MPVYGKDPIWDRTFCTVMIYRPPIQPFKDKWRPNWTVAESMINDAISLIVDQIGPTLANSTAPPPSPSHQSLFTLSVILEIHRVYEMLRTPAAPVK